MPTAPQIGSTSMAAEGRLKNRNRQPAMVSGPMMISPGTRKARLRSGADLRSIITEMATATNA